MFQVSTIDKLYPQKRNLFFDDGKRKIDCVLAYKEVSAEDQAEKQEKFKRWRQNFFKQLVEEGLELELDERVSRLRCLHIFRWVHPSLYEGVSVRPSDGWMDGPSDGWMVRRMVTCYFF